MKKYRFKSSTDVNNYNKFLLDLDGIIKKNIDESIVKKMNHYKLVSTTLTRYMMRQMASIQ